MNASRISTAVVLVVVMLLSFRPWDFIWSLATMASGTIGAAFTAPLMLGLYWKRGTAAGSIAGIVSGAVVSVIWYGLGLTYIIHSYVPGMVVSFIAFIAVSKMTQSLPKALIDVFFEKNCDLSAIER